MARLVGKQPPEGQVRREAGRLELREVTKRYRGSDRPAVDDLSLTVEAGQVCVLVGPSGCGKTTALRMINRLIEPSAGDILLDGASTRERSAASLRREIGYVIQQVGLLPHQTVAKNVATVPRLLGWSRSETKTRVNEMLELVGLDPDEYGPRYPAQLSGGQQQRVGLARALAGDPPLMLMDEPFSAVDPITRERLQNDFLRLHRTVPKTVVFVSHDIDEAVKMADKVAVMRDGQVVQYAPPAALLAAPADDFVADFVGADRALKALGLTRIEEIELEDAPLVEAGAASSKVLDRIASGLLTPVDGDLLVAVEGRPRAWMSVGRVTSGHEVPRGPVGSPGPIIDRLATLRDALSALLDANARSGAVVDADGRCVGLVSVDDIQGSWNAQSESALASHG